MNQASTILRILQQADQVANATITSLQQIRFPGGGAPVVAGQFAGGFNNHHHDLRESDYDNDEEFIGLLPLAWKFIKWCVFVGFFMASSVIIYGCLYYLVMPKNHIIKTLYFDYTGEVSPPIANRDDIRVTPWASIDLFAKYDNHWEVMFPLDSTPLSSMRREGEEKSEEEDYSEEFEHQNDEDGNKFLLQQQQAIFSELTPSLNMVKNRSSYLISNQEYFIDIELTLPETESNSQSGIFGIMVELHSSNGTALTKSIRPARFPHESLWLGFARKFVLVVPLLLGAISESKTVNIQPYRHYVENKHYPLRYIIVRLVRQQIGGTINNERSRKRSKYRSNTSPPDGVDDKEAEVIITPKQKQSSSSSHHSITTTIPQSKPYVEVVHGNIRIGKEMNTIQQVLYDWFYTCYCIGTVIICSIQLLIFFCCKILVESQVSSELPDAPSEDFNELNGSMSEYFQIPINSSDDGGNTNNTFTNANRRRRDLRRRSRRKRRSTRRNNSGTNSNPGTSSDGGDWEELDSENEWEDITPQNLTSHDDSGAGASSTATSQPQDQDVVFGMESLRYQLETRQEEHNQASDDAVDEQLQVMQEDEQGEQEVSQQSAEAKVDAIEPPPVAKPSLTPPVSAAESVTKSPMPASLIDKKSSSSPVKQKRSSISRKATRVKRKEQSPHRKPSSSKAMASIPKMKAKKLSPLKQFSMSPNMNEKDSTIDEGSKNKINIAMKANRKLFTSAGNVSNDNSKQGASLKKKKNRQVLDLDSELQGTMTPEQQTDATATTTTTTFVKNAPTEEGNGENKNQHDLFLATDAHAKIVGDDNKHCANDNDGTSLSSSRQQQQQDQRQEESEEQNSTSSDSSFSDSISSYSISISTSTASQEVPQLVADNLNTK